MVFATPERRWWTLGVLCLSLVIVVIDNTVLNVALPTISRELDAGATALQWMVDAYALVFAGLLLTGGALGDRFGRKGFLSLGLVVFGLASLAATQASAPWHIVAARGVMGVGAALVMPATLSIITAVFPPHEQPRAIGMWAGLAGAGAALGPILGGYLVDHFSWSAVFYINVPVVAVALVGGALLVPTSRDPQRRPLDPIGALVSIGGLAMLVYAVIEAPNQGWLSSSTLLELAGAAMLLGAFALWERRAEHPLLPLGLFRDPRFSAASWAIMVQFMTMIGMFFVLTQYLQFVRGYSPMAAALRFSPGPTTMIAAAASSARLVERFGARRIVTLGMLVTIVGMAGLSVVDASASYAVLALVLGTLGVGSGLVMPPATASIMSALPAGKAGVGSAVNDTTREVGAALGIGIMGSVLASRYASAMREGLPPVPAPVRDLAGEGIGPALVAARRLGSPIAAQLADAARDAFVSGMRVSLWVAVALLAVGALVVHRFFPARTDAGAPAEPELAPEPAPAHASAGELVEIGGAPGPTPAVEEV